MTNIDVSAVFEHAKFQTKAARLEVHGFDGEMSHVQLQHSKQDSQRISLKRDWRQRLNDALGAEKSRNQIISELQTAFRTGTQDGYVLIQKKRGDDWPFEDRARIEIPNPNRASDSPDTPVLSPQELPEEALAR